jgi:glycosyltransferase involved in cell wall biosynthesis
VLFTNSVTSLEQKIKFINTCDAMLHARLRGETFGLSILEFMANNKPIFTYGNSPEKNHYLLLNNNGIIYNSYEELINQLYNFTPKQITYNNLKDFLPEVVIKKFHKTFLH